MGRAGRRPARVAVATRTSLLRAVAARYVTFYKEVTPALLLSGVLSLIPGLFLTAFTNVFQNVPGLLMMVPALIGMRGNIFGALCSRLSTDVQVKKSTVYSFVRRIEFFDSFTMFEALFLSWCLPVLCLLASPLLPSALSSFDILSFICLCSGLLSGTIMLFCTKYVIRKSIAAGLNPDNIGPPLVTTIGDLITLPIIISVTWLCLYLPLFMRWVCIVLLVGFMLYSAYDAYTLSKPRVFFTTGRERIPVMLACMAISFVAGIALEGVLVAFGHRAVIAAYFALVPLINAQGGSGGSVIASRTTTRHFSGPAGADAAAAAAVAAAAAARDAADAAAVAAAAASGSTSRGGQAAQTAATAAANAAAAASAAAREADAMALRELHVDNNNESVDGIDEPPVAGAGPARRARGRHGDANGSGNAAPRRNARLRAAASAAAAADAEHGGAATGAAAPAPLPSSAAPSSLAPPPPPRLSIFSEAVVLTVSIWSVYVIVATILFAFTPDLDSYVQLLQIMTSMSALIGVACSSIAVGTVRLAVRFNYHPDNVAVPVVCAMMDVVASWGYSGLLWLLV